MDKDTIIKTALNNFYIEMGKLGCSNHSCHFHPPKGMGTNSSCSCLNSIHDWKLKAAISNLFYILKSSAVTLDLPLRHFNDSYYPGTKL